ncbi:MAG: hypothetical protein JO359_13090, partial [Candidatus Eremiobacteraeota bacterium]|nr:hypothetical protein [Candidatus Eremiobacteraeota bacterium]
AVKVNLQYTSAPQPPTLPHGIVDEIEILSFGPLGSHASYRVEQYAVDGGLVGSTRDAFLEYVSDPSSAWHGRRNFVADALGGQFTLPLPNDPETERPTQNHYAIYDQTVGNNPFNLFDDRIGLNVGYGNRFAQVNAVAAKGHDPQSGLPTSGTDEMFVARAGPDVLSAWAYLYAGTRSLGPAPDRFVRRAFGLTSSYGKSETSFLLQTGNDSSPFGDGAGVASSGGYLQEEWHFSSRLAAVARYDGLGANNFLRTTTLTLNYRPYDRARLTLEGVFASHATTLNAAWLFAY